MLWVRPVIARPAAIRYGAATIYPGTVVDGKSEDELVAAFLAQGLSADDARTYARALLERDERFPID